MDKENQRIVKLLIFFADAANWFFSLTAAFWLRFYVLPHDNRPFLPLERYLAFLVILIPCYFLIYHANGLYDAFRRRTIISELGKIIRANIYGAIALFLVFFIFKEVDVSRLMLFLFTMISTVISCVVRTGGRLTMRSLRRKGYNTKHLLLVGCNKTADRFYRRIITNRDYGYIVDGYINHEPTSFGWEVPYLGDFERLTEVIQQLQADEIVISLDYNQFDELGNIIEICETQGIKSSLLPFYNRYLPAHPQVDVFDGIPIINLRHIPLDNIFYAFLKRSFDFFASLFGLILLSPLMLGTMAIIKLTSPGPVIYKQQRIGKNRKEFTMYKFRSMRVENNADATTWGGSKDERRTNFGAFIRKFSIDELPQLYNVLRGDMSLVGPRPERPFFVERFRDEVPLYMLKHLVRPGITGWAQINGWRGDTSILERIKCDMYYIENWSFLFDIKILILTIFKGIVNPNETL